MPIAVIVAFLIALGRVSSVVVDWAAWFSTIGYVGVFWTVFATKAALFVVSWRCLRGPGLVAMGQWNTYTTSNWFPYAQAQPDGDTNYIRNSAKVVIDAYNGTITLYVADAADPIVATYRRIFPTLFKPSGFAKAHPLSRGPVQHPGSAVPNVPHGCARGILQSRRSLAVAP